MVVFYVVAGLVGPLVIASVVAYFTLAVPAMRKAPPLPDGDVEYCRRVVAQGRGYPWVCVRGVRTGRCPCQPCAKVAREKGAPR
jgi:hypothetical protein